MMKEDEERRRRKRSKWPLFVGSVLFLSAFIVSFNFDSGEPGGTLCLLVAVIGLIFVTHYIA